MRQRAARVVDRSLLPVFGCRRPTRRCSKLSTRRLAEVGDEDAPALSAVLAEHTEAGTETLRERRREAEAEISASHASIAALKSERKAVSAEHDDAPPAFHARTDNRSELGGAPLWQLVRFADSVEPDVATGIESALQAANLLDGWVCPDEKIPEHVSEQFLTALPVKQRPKGRTLADVLEVEGNADVPDARVQDILASISLVEAPGDSDASVAIGVDGRFWQGVARGRHVKADAEYIGTTARARRREARITEIGRGSGRTCRGSRYGQGTGSADQRATEPDQLCGKGIAEDRFDPARTQDGHRIRRRTPYSLGGHGNGTTRTRCGDR